MRPEKAIRRVQKAINAAIKVGNLTPLLSVANELDQLTKKYHREETQTLIDYECDFELECYYELVFNRNTLIYISDRWTNYGRTSWLDGLVKLKLQ
jgi:hypothetical protein